MSKGFVFIAALGGALVGFTYGMTHMYNKTMDGLGLIEGGTPSYLDIETLYYVQRLMSDIFPVSKAYIFGIAGLIIISVGILAAFLIPLRSKGVKPPEKCSPA